MHEYFVSMGSFPIDRSRHLLTKNERKQACSMSRVSAADTEANTLAILGNEPQHWKVNSQPECRDWCQEWELAGVWFLRGSPLVLCPCPLLFQWHLPAPTSTICLLLPANRPGLFPCKALWILVSIPQSTSFCRESSQILVCALDLVLLNWHD